MTKEIKKKKREKIKPKWKLVDLKLPALLLAYYWSCVDT